MSLNDERSFVRSIVEALGKRSAALIGDDAASLQLPAGRFAITVDSQVAGVHFPLELDPGTMARRLLAVNLSDLAAAGIDPSLEIFGFLALAAPRGFATEAFFTALGEAAAGEGVTIAGGDLARSPTLSASLTLIGQHGEGRPLLRSQARAGDRLWVGGTVGESALGRHLLAAGATWEDGQPSLAGLDLPAHQRAASDAVQRHLAPQPQLALGHWLAQQPRAAAIDVSDGLSLDLYRLLEASKVGAEIEGTALPLSPAAAPLARAVDENALELALSGGEDYVLLFALPAHLELPTAFGATSIGRILSDRGLFLRDGPGRRPLQPEGWDHLGSP